MFPTVAMIRIHSWLLAGFLGATLLVAQRSPAEQGERTHPPENLRTYIDNELAAGQKRIVVPPGTYRVTPVKREHLVFRNLSDITVIADGVEMICTETTRAVTINNCRNLKIQGLTIDYDPLPYTQGRLVKLSENNTVHEIELFDGYPPAEKVIDSKYEIFRADTRTLRFGSYHRFTHRKLETRRIEVTRKGRYRGEKVGDIIVINTKHAPGGSIPHAVYTSNSKHVTLQDITLYASNCFGFLENGCEANYYLRCRIDRRAAAEDVRKRGDPRIRSLDADAYHSKHAIVGPTIEKCVARFMGDDCINICGDYHLVMGCDGNKLRVLAKRRLDIEPGDPLEVVSYTGRRLPDAKAVRVSKPIGKATGEDLEFLSRQRMHAPFRQGKLGRIHEVRIDRAVDLPVGSVIGAANRMGSGFRVIGCDFGFNRSRGILIKASNGIVKDNRLEGCWGEAVKIAPEYWWLESGSSSNVKILGNTIKNCFGKGIAVYAVAGKGGTAPAGAHNDIVIENNTITNTGAPHIWVTSTRGLVLRGNRYDRGALKIEKCEDIQRQNRAGN